MNALNPKIVQSIKVTYLQRKKYYQINNINNAQRIQTTTLLNFH